MKVERSGHGGWNDYPVYRCKTSDAYTEIKNWCYQHGVETFLVVSGGGEYKFQVKTHHELFVLRWL